MDIFLINWYARRFKKVYIFKSRIFKLEKKCYGSPRDSHEEANWVKNAKSLLLMIGIRSLDSDVPFRIILSMYFESKVFKQIDNFVAKKKSNMQISISGSFKN